MDTVIEWKAEFQKVLDKAEEMVKSAREIIAKSQKESMEAIKQVEDKSNSARQEAREAITAARQAAEASREAARQAADVWIGVFRELVDEAGDVNRTTGRVTREIAEAMAKIPDPGDISPEALAESEEGAEEAVLEAGQKTKSKKKEEKKGKGMMHSRLEALEKMFTSSKDEPEDDDIPSINMDDDD
jgi:hypothetical protein